MAYENQAITYSGLSLDMPNEPTGNYKGSNEFILIDKSTSHHAITSNIKLIYRWCQTKAKKSFQSKNFKKKFPIITWLPKYTLDDGIGDVVAGITVGLTVIPQALAYAGIANLPVEYGLYGAFLGCFVYIFLGSCKDVPIGPTAIQSLLTFQAAKGVWQKSVLLAFLVGIIELAMGLFNLGFLLDFVSGPVSSGFTSAVSLIILSSQIKDLIGINASGGTFLEMWSSIINNITDIKMYDTILGCLSIIVLLLMRKMATLRIGPSDDNLKTTKNKIFNKTIWLIGTARNAILVIVTGSIGAAIYEPNQDYLRLVGYIPQGLPNFQVPPFSIPEVRNETTNEIVTEAESFSQIISSMGSAFIVVPLIALLENIAICKAFGDGKSIDVTQELIAIGTSNIVNSFAQGYPGTGALSRGAVNNASGVRTPLGGLYTGSIVILALLFLTPLFAYIPKATLAAIIIAAVIFMVEVKVIRPMWRSKKTDLIPGLAAFIACLVLRLEIGILVGIGINVIFILYHAARPKITVEILTTKSNLKYLMLTPDRCLIFPSIEYVKNVINKQGMRSQVPVIIDCSHIYGADYTAAKVIESLIKDFAIRDQLLIFYNLKPTVGEVFDGLDINPKVVYNLDAIEREILRTSLT